MIDITGTENVNVPDINHHHNGLLAQLVRALTVCERGPQFESWTGLIVSTNVTNFLGLALWPTA